MKEQQQLTADEIIQSINERIELPFVSAKFGDNWKDHVGKQLLDNEITPAMLINLAWVQGRRALMLEDALKKAMKQP
jgi:hypothetical protein